MTLKRTRVPAHPANYSRGRPGPVLYIVVHTGETGEGTTPAEGMGNWFAQYHGPGAASSAHRGADTDSICTYVEDGDTAYGAPGVNATGWHLELAGRAGQTSGEWADDASALILANGAIAAAEAADRLNVPARWLTDAQLRAGVERGFITHAQASRVLGGDHWDPGPNFPAQLFMTLVRSHLGLTTTNTTGEETMSQQDVDQLRDYIGAVLVKGYTVAGKQYPGIAAVNIENQRRITATSEAVAIVSARVGALATAVQQLAAGQPLDFAAIEAAARQGAADAIKSITVTVEGGAS